jgi:hypothetical protein
MASSAQAGAARGRVSGFTAEDAALMRDARTVRIETSPGTGKPVHRAIIWIVVDEAGRAFVRSWLGERGRWYRDLLAHPDGAVHVGERRIRVRAMPADEEAIETCSRLLSVKHRASRGSLASMLRDEVLGTTLELKPAPAGSSIALAVP